MSVEKTEENSRKSLASVLKEAQRIIEAAEKRAADLNLASQTAFEESKRKGFVEGFNQGLSEASKTAVRFIEQTSHVNQQLSEEAAKLAIAICSKIISEQVKIKPDFINSIAQKALSQSVLGDKVIFVINPEDKKILESAKESLTKLAGGATIFIETDLEIQRGGCIVKTDFGEVDALIPSLIKGMADRLGINDK